ncbi:MAG TPA: hypothetical protein PKE31_05370 [Pseudomonadota bacterium]|nr:hypothetical protein [Pseudomonadota bacterium]
MTAKNPEGRELSPGGAMQVRYEDGWRQGKPVEDPAKMKRWGFITAQPSEYLVVVRNGKMDTRSSGQGMRVWKWPWTAVATIPTSLQQIEFMADQITKERVGVSITGLAVYRIAQPEIAYRMLNFTYAERASEKLGQTLRDMFIGAARRLIANLSLNECLEHRKEAIASFLMREISPVVSGSGRPEDTTDQGWGVVLDTIEIQDVKILSDVVFKHLQAPYRAEIAMRAEQAELDRQRQVAETRAAAERQTQEAAIASQRETRISKAKAEAEAAEREAHEAMRAEQAKAKSAAEELLRKESLARKRIEVEEGIALRQAESKGSLEQKNQHIRQEAELAQLKLQEQKKMATAQADMATLATEAELAEKAHKLELRKLELEQARKQLKQKQDLALQSEKARYEQEERKQETETQRLENEADIAKQRAEAEIELLLSQGRVMKELVVTGLPHIAQAFKQSFGTINYTQFSGSADGNPMAMIGSAISQVLAVAKNLGLDPAKLQPPQSQPATPVSAQGGETDSRSTDKE